MLQWTTTSTPIGDVLLMATDEGLVRIAFALEGFDEVRARVAERVGEEPVENADALATATRQLGEYFAGSRRAFDLPLDWSLSSGFYSEVERLLPSIPYGRTLTYSELAERAGRPKAHRAAASACARNPLPLVVPCHRVTRRDGSFGGYLGGLEAKRYLLDFEAGRLPS